MNRPALHDGRDEVTAGRGRVSFVVSGAGCAGSPLVLLPSLGGGADCWGEFGNRLAAERCTLALDPPGFGNSSRPPAWLTTKTLAECLLAALDSLHVDTFDLFGCSLGALLATRVALLAPERVERLALASAAARGRDFVPRRLAKGIRLVRDFVKSSHPIPAIARDVAGAAESGAPRRPKVAGAAWSRGRVLHFLSAALTHDATEELGRLHMPVLLLYGEQDVLLSADAQRRLGACLAHAELRTFPRVGHNLVNEAPDACADALLSFLRAV